MSPVAQKNYQSTHSQFSDAEWGVRVDLAACYRLIAHFGMSDLIYNHITARVPDSEDYLINPYGMMYEEITASSLLRIDSAGKIVGEHSGEYGVNQAGYVIHGAIHEARPDVSCVIHTHTRAGMAVSAMRCGLIPVAQTCMRFHKIAYHDYESVALDLDERQRLVNDLGDLNAMILRNHGLLTAAPSIPQAFNLMYWLEMTCKVQVDVMAAEKHIELPSQAILEKTYGLYQPSVRLFGEREWPAMLRLLDRRDQSYRE